MSPAPAIPTRGSLDVLPPRRPAGPPPDDGGPSDVRAHLPRAGRLARRVQRYALVAVALPVLLDYNLPPSSTFLELRLARWWGGDFSARCWRPPAETGGSPRVGGLAVLVAALVLLLVPWWCRWSARASPSGLGAVVPRAHRRGHPRGLHRPRPCRRPGRAAQRPSRSSASHCSATALAKAWPSPSCSTSSRRSRGWRPCWRGRPAPAGWA